jgi:hypothetical protein
MNITISLEGDKLVIENLNAMPGKVQRLAGKGLKLVARGVHRNAMDFLNGSGAKGEYVTTKTGKTRWQKRETPVLAGGYPVPVRTGNLKRLLDFLDPGETFSNDRGSFTTGKTEIVVFDSARYARVIHEGLGSSAKFGKRPYLHDALQKFNAGDNIVHIVTREIEKGLSR